MPWSQNQSSCPQNEPALFRTSCELAPWRWTGTSISQPVAEVPSCRRVPLTAMWSSMPVWSPPMRRSPG
ncbi:MAG: hypothetical protein IJV65_06830 [Kiritimatiellae bacterium]|nr:hypothetical protein [Kiritimatiellia bacterium]